MRTIEIGPTTTLTLPDGWRAFTYHGFLYVRGWVKRTTSMRVASARSGRHLIVPTTDRDGK